MTVCLAVLAKANDNDFVTPDQALLLINSWGYDVPASELEEKGSNLTFKTFMRVMFNKAKANSAQKSAVESFRTFDIDGDGFVTAAELRNGLNMIGDAITDEEADAMIKDADVDGDGRLNYIEYKEKMGVC